MKYTVLVALTTSATLELTVEAENETEARELADKLANQAPPEDWNDYIDNYSINIIGVENT